MTHEERYREAQERTDKARRALQAAQDELNAAKKAEREADADLLRWTLKNEIGRQP